jgi:hypothetical protein
MEDDTKQVAGHPTGPKVKQLWIWVKIATYIVQFYRVVCSMSQLCGMLKKPTMTWESHC